MWEVFWLYTFKNLSRPLYNFQNSDYVRLLAKSLWYYCYDGLQLFPSLDWQSFNQNNNL